MILFVRFVVFVVSREKRREKRFSRQYYAHVRVHLGETFAEREREREREKEEARNTLHSYAAPEREKTFKTDNLLNIPRRRASKLFSFAEDCPACFFKSWASSRSSSRLRGCCCCCCRASSNFEEERKEEEEDDDGGGGDIVFFFVSSRASRVVSFCARFEREDGRTFLSIV